MFDKPIAGFPNKQSILINFIPYNKILQDKLQKYNNFKRNATD